MISLFKKNLDLQVSKAQTEVTFHHLHQNSDYLINILCSMYSLNCILITSGKKEWVLLIILLANKIWHKLYSKITAEKIFSSQWQPKHLPYLSKSRMENSACECYSPQMNGQFDVSKTQAVCLQDRSVTFCIFYLIFTCLCFINAACKKQVLCTKPVIKSAD